LNNTSSKTLWIGEIDGWMDEKFLAKVFSDYAIVKNVKVIRDKVTGMHQGYGFVEFESAEVANYVLETCSGNMIPNSNRSFKLNWATFSAGKMQAIFGTTTIQEHTIYVCDLDLYVTEDMLTEIFEKIYPSVTSSKLIVDPITKGSKGYGFVKFGDYTESQRAIVEMNGKYILNKAIKTNQAVWKKFSPDTNKNVVNLQKSYQNNYYSKGGYGGKNQEEGFRKNSHQEEGYRGKNHQEGGFGNNNHQENYYKPTHNYNYTASNTSTSTGSPVYTQNINIYLQSLYQQHYLNNVYLNQYLNSNGNLIPEFGTFSIEGKDESDEGNNSTEVYSKNNQSESKTI